MSKEMQPNRLNEAIKEVKGMGLDGVSVPEKMNTADRYHNQVLIIASTPNPAKMKYEHKVKRQSFNEVSFEIFKTEAEKNPTQKIVLFHSATLQKQMEFEAGEEAAKPAKLKKLNKKEAADFAEFTKGGDDAIEAGNKEEAIQFYEEALKIQPGEPEVTAKLEAAKQD